MEDNWPHQASCSKFDQVIPRRSRRRPLPYRLSRCNSTVWCGPFHLFTKHSWSWNIRPPSLCRYYLRNWMIMSKYWPMVPERTQCKLNEDGAECVLAFVVEGTWLLTELQPTRNLNYSQISSRNSGRNSSKTESCRRKMELYSPSYLWARYAKRRRQMPSLSFYPIQLVYENFDVKQMPSESRGSE